MNTNRSIVEKVRKMAGNKIAMQLEKELEAKKAIPQGKLAVSLLLKGKTVKFASVKSGLTEKRIINIIYGLNKSAGQNWKDVRHKRFLPTLANGEPDLTGLPITIKR